MKHNQRIKIRFYAELNDFLPENLQKRVFTVNYHLQQTIKDLIESLNVPHIAVDLILVNSKPVDFNYIVQPNDYISVYPEIETFNIDKINKLRKEPLRNTKFIVDVNLGQLAKNLRFLGFDSKYRNDYKDEKVVEISNREKRLILTRDIGLLKRNNVKRGYWVRNLNPDQQTTEILRKFDLFGDIKPFKYCSACNGKIEAIDKSRIIDRLEPKTKKYYQQFYICKKCKKIYWKGSHFRKLEKKISAFSNNKAE